MLHHSARVAEKGNFGCRRRSGHQKAHPSTPNCFLSYLLSSSSSKANEAQPTMLLQGGRLSVARPLRDLLGASLIKHGYPTPGSVNKPNVRWPHSFTRQWHQTTTPQPRWKQAPVARSFHTSPLKFNSNTPPQASKPAFDTSKSLIGGQAQAAKSTVKTPTSLTSTSTTGSGSGSTVGSGAGSGSGSSEAVNAAQNNLDWKILKELARYIWPKNDTNAKIRVVTASTLLVLSQLLNIQVPFFFKEIVDNLNVEFPIGSTVGMVVGASIVGCKVAYYVFSFQDDAHVKSKYSIGLFLFV